MYFQLAEMPLDSQRLCPVAAKYEGSQSKNPLPCIRRDHAEVHKGTMMLLRTTGIISIEHMAIIFIYPAGFEPLTLPSRGWDSVSPVCMNHSHSATAHCSLALSNTVHSAHKLNSRCQPIMSRTAVHYKRGLRTLDRPGWGPAFSPRCSGSLRMSKIVQRSSTRW